MDINKNVELDSIDISKQIEGDFIALVDDFFTLPSFFDDELDKIIARWNSNPPEVKPKKPYFSPSSLSSCPRELYIKAKYGGSAKDKLRDKPWRGRWRSLGTLAGDLMQRELLSIERNYVRLTGNIPKFVFEYNEDGTPVFEEFAKKNKKMNVDGEEFYLYGSPDGVMVYTTDLGEEIRVGLEIKSKQSTPARTSMYSMKGPDESHSSQVVAYAEMFDLDYYMIVYVNLAKQSWNMTDEQYKKTPDIRAFCKKYDESDKYEVFSKAADITRAIREDDAPRLDINKWMFNNYKQKTAESLSNSEISVIREDVEDIKRTNIPKWKVRQLDEVLSTIEDMRGDYVE